MTNRFQPDATPMCASVMWAPKPAHISHDRDFAHAYAGRARQVATAERGELLHDRLIFEPVIHNHVARRPFRRTRLGRYLRSAKFRRQDLPAFAFALAYCGFMWWLCS